MAGRRALHVLRFVLTAPYSVLALLWGLALGARVAWAPGLMLACSGMRWGFGRGGTTVGSVWLYGDLGGPARLRHETRHATQWAIFGPFFPVLYGLDELFFPGVRNHFERWAGLVDGGYVDQPAPGQAADAASRKSPTTER